MTMPDGQKYICTQGPLQEYVGDFWHMVASEKSKVIVMLCNFNEGNLTFMRHSETIYEF
uniref:protein-tyrosine-phosphatase n=1 Tax=Angiostrongylus cantonensis TaxID=6313 RepID=A0A0K0CX62_ANGCA